MPRRNSARSFRCGICRRPFDNATAKSRHVREAHDPPAPKPGSNGGRPSAINTEHFDTPPAPPVRAPRTTPYHRPN